MKESDVRLTSSTVQLGLDTLDERVLQLIGRKRARDPNVKGLKDENADPADPDNFYGWEKLLSEKTCEAYQSDCGFDIRIARYHNIYGPEGTYKGGRKNLRCLMQKSGKASNSGAR